MDPGIEFSIDDIALHSTQTGETRRIFDLEHDWSGADAVLLLVFVQRPDEDDEEFVGERVRHGAAILFEPQNAGRGRVDGVAQQLGISLGRLWATWSRPMEFGGGLQGCHWSGVEKRSQGGPGAPQPAPVGEVRASSVLFHPLRIVAGGPPRVGGNGIPWVVVMASRPLRRHSPRSRGEIPLQPTDLVDQMIRQQDGAAAPSQVSDGENSATRRAVGAVVRALIAHALETTDQIADSLHAFEAAALADRPDSPLLAKDELHIDWLDTTGSSASSATHERQRAYISFLAHAPVLAQIRADLAVFKRWADLAQSKRVQDAAAEAGSRVGALQAEMRERLQVLMAMSAFDAAQAERARGAGQRRFEKRVQRIAALVVGPTLVVGYFGTNVLFPFDLSKQQYGWAWVLAAVLVAMALGAMWLRRVEDE